MKKIITLILLAVFMIAVGCRAKYSFNSYDGKKKLKHYNSIQYGHKQYPNTKKRNK